MPLRAGGKATKKARDVNQKLAAAVAAVAVEFDSDVILYNAPIAEDGYGRLIQELGKASGKRKNCLLVLVTYGGLANSAYRIARLLQRTYDKFYVFVPSYCKSAGTILALGCSALIMSEFGELGPLDVQLFKPDEIGERKSGLLMHSAFESLNEKVFSLFESILIGIKQKSGGLVTFPVAAQIAGEITATAMQPIYAQINPEVLGDDYRDLQVAYHYGMRLAIHGGNGRLETIKHLVEHYPSHDFVIDPDEAEALFEDVRAPSKALYGLYEVLGNSITIPRDDGSSEVRLLNPGVDGGRDQSPSGENHGNDTKNGN